MRIGHGYDVHAFCEGSGITLCGVSIPYTRGFLAHSDGDVALHALCDALLGAAALGDIGRHFPDTDKAFENIDSRILLRRVRELLAEKGLQCNNADLTIVAQSPKLAPHIPDMLVVLAADLGIAADRINVKATTSEKLGFTGRSEGIAAYAVVTVSD
ncbi:2-C-methyl-D-erythritol 2,4-cyclodiphosphate synthase [Chromatiales bacterium (ex Bugula neritina AB1)]|nr:2-C-methyl-D-erythritol 2,4-cyclodiphosphate synthase [Chromatiales bacterium (ex Bugula neritina AB1)]